MDSGNVKNYDQSINRPVVYLVPHTHYDAIWVFTKEDYFYINIELICTCKTGNIIDNHIIELEVGRFKIVTLKVKF
jgi:hypothetical protein